MTQTRKVVVLDSNLVVSALLHPQGAAALALQRAIESFEIAASHETLAELTEVLRRDKFDRYAAPSLRLQRLAAYVKATLKVNCDQTVADCIDPKDNKFLALALASNAVALVTGDKKHLLSMHPYKGIDILSVRDFLAQCLKPA